MSTKTNINKLGYKSMNKLLDFFKQYWKTLLFFAIVGVLGGYAVGLYLLDSYPAEIQQQLIEELNSAGLGGLPVNIVLGAITAFTSLQYGVIFGAFGIFLGKKVGLWKDERIITKKPLLVAILIAVVCGLLLILPDLLFFNDRFQSIADSYKTKPNFIFLLACVAYGGVIEEVLLRLFMMSLITLILNRLFNKKAKLPTTVILVVSNIVAALLFAAGHLPATFMMLGSDPLIILRCFLLNGGVGLLFGLLYRKYGLRYAMIAHAGTHIVSKLIWILFI